MQIFFVSSCGIFICTQKPCCMLRRECAAGRADKKYLYLYGCRNRFPAGAKSDENIKKSWKIPGKYGRINAEKGLHAGDCGKGACMQTAISVLPGFVPTYDENKEGQNHGKYPKEIGRAHV